MIFRFWNGAAPSTAISVAVATGTDIKTMLQALSLRQGRVIEWGCFFNASAAAVPIPVELFESDVAATVTAHVEVDVVHLGPGTPGQIAATYFTLSTTGCGFTASGEGTPTTASRVLDSALIPPTGGLVKQFPLGREPALTAGDFLRVRVHAAATVDCLCYFDIEIG